MKTHTATRRTQNSLHNIVKHKTLSAILSPKTFRKSQYKHDKLKNFEYKLYKLNNKYTEAHTKNKLNYSHICIHQFSQTSLIMMHHNGKVKLPLCLIKHHAMNIHGRGEGKLHPFLTSTLDRDMWSASGISTVYSKCCKMNNV
jgi:hypothetical protein